MKALSPTTTTSPSTILTNMRGQRAFFKKFKKRGPSPHTVTGDIKISCAQGQR